jgi:hypothetical protein
VGVDIVADAGVSGVADMARSVVLRGRGVSRFFVVSASGWWGGACMVGPMQGG